MYCTSMYCTRTYTSMSSDLCMLAWQILTDVMQIVLDLLHTKCYYYFSMFQCMQIVERLERLGIAREEYLILKVRYTKFWKRKKIRVKFTILQKWEKLQRRKIAEILFSKVMSYF